MIVAGLREEATPPRLFWVCTNENAVFSSSSSVTMAVQSSGHTPCKLREHEDVNVIADRTHRHGRIVPRR